MRTLAAIALALLALSPAQAQEVPPPPDTGVRRSAPAGPLRLDLELANHDLREVLSEIGRLAGKTIELAPEVQERLTVSLVEFRWREAVDALVGMARCQVEELAPNVLWISQPALVTARFEEADVAGVLRTVGAYGGQQVVLGPGVTGRVSVDLARTPWPQALQQIGAAVGARVELRPGLALVLSGPAPPRRQAPGGPAPRRPGRPVTLELDLDEDVANAVEAIARQAGENALVDPEVVAHVRLSLRDAPFRAAVELVARLTRCEVEERAGLLLLTRPSTTRYDAVGAPAGAWFQLLSAYAGLDYAGADVQGQVDCALTGLHYFEVLAVTARTTGHVVDWSPTDEAPESVRVRGRRPDEDLLAATPQDALGDLLAQVERLARDGDSTRLEPRLAELLARVRARTPSPPTPPAGPSDEAVERLDQLLYRLRTPDAVVPAAPVVTELRALLREQGLPLARVALARLALDPPEEVDRYDALTLELRVDLGNLLLRAMGEAFQREDVPALAPLFAEIDALAYELYLGPRDEAGRALYLAARQLRYDGERLQALLAFNLELTATLVPPPGPEPRSAIINGWILREGDPVMGHDGEPIEAMRVVEVRPRSVRIRWEDTSHLLTLPPR